MFVSICEFSAISTLPETNQNRYLKVGKLLSFRDDAIFAGAKLPLVSGKVAVTAFAWDSYVGKSKGIRTNQAKNSRPQ